MNKTIKVNVDYLINLVNDPNMSFRFRSPVLKLSGDNYFIRAVERDSRELCVTVNKKDFVRLINYTKLNKREEK